MRKLVAFVLSLAGAYLVAAPIGKWFDARYAGGGFIYWGPFPGYLDGLLFGYVFFASLLFPSLTNKIKLGVYWASPVILLDLVSGSYTQLGYSFILLAAGLGLAWMILFVKRYIKYS